MMNNLNSNKGLFQMCDHKKPKKIMSFLALSISTALFIPSLCMAQDDPFAPINNEMATANQTLTQIAGSTGVLQQIANSTNYLPAQIYPLLNNINSMATQSNTSLGDLDKALTDKAPDFPTLFTNFGITTLQPAFGSEDWAADFSSMSVGPLSSATPPLAVPPAQTPTVPTSYTGLLNQMWVNLCGDPNSLAYFSYPNPVVNNTTPTTGSGHVTLGTSTSNYTLSSNCEQAIALSNANNIIPLVMPLSEYNWTAPDSPVLSNVPSNIDSTYLMPQIQTLLTPIQVPVVNSKNDRTSSNSSGTTSLSNDSTSSGTTSLSPVQNYIDQLTEVPSSVQNVPSSSLPNAMPELTLISGVLQSVAQDYQSGKMDSMEQAVNINQTSNGPWQTQLAQADVPGLLRILILQTAMSNQIKVAALEQDQKNTVLLAAILADLVKSNQLNAGVINSITGLNTTVKNNQQYLISIGNSIARAGNEK